MTEPRVMVPKTNRDVDELVQETMDWAATQNLVLEEQRIRERVEECRYFKLPYLRPFTDEEMRHRW
jgi:hypothetical protein